VLAAHQPHLCARVRLVKPCAWERGPGIRAKDAPASGRTGILTGEAGTPNAWQASPLPETPLQEPKNDSDPPSMYYVNVYEVAKDPVNPRRLVVIRTIRSISVPNWPEAYVVQKQMKADYRDGQYMVVIEDKPGDGGTA